MRVARRSEVEGHRRPEWTRGSSATPGEVKPVSGDLWRRLFGPWSVGVGMAVVAGAASGVVWLDPAGLGIDLCWVRRLSDLPCPGCGLTRSVVSLARGELAQSLALHPFGVAVLGWALLAASSPIWPRALKRVARVWVAQRRPVLDRIYQGLILAFVGFGLLRFLVAWVETVRAA